MRIRVMASRHSAFYSPLLSAIHMLRNEGHDVPYSVLGAGQRSYALIRDAAVDIMQSAVSSNWKGREMGVEPLPVHFAQINQRDGFFLAASEPDANFEWKKLEGHTLLADQGAQPLAMLKHAVKHNGVDWTRIKVLRKGNADYTHLQAPFPEGEIVASVGASMPKVAFSSLCCSRAYQKSEGYQRFSGGLWASQGVGPQRSRHGDRGGGSCVLSRCAAGAAERCDPAIPGAGMLGRRYRNSPGSLRTGIECVSSRRRNRLAPSL